MYGYQLISSYFAPKTFKTSGKWVQNAFLGLKNIGLLGHKTPYFPSQTSELCAQEVRCFTFSGRKWRKNPRFPDFAIFGVRTRRGGFRGHSQPINDGFREAEAY